MEINHYFYNIMNVNKCPLKYVISLCLTVWAAGALFAQPVVSSSDSAYGRALYKRIMRLNPDSLLRAHADPAVYQRTITAESGSDSIYSREDKRWFYIDRNEFHRVIAAGPSYDTYEYIYATYKGYFYHLSREKLLHEADLAEQAADKYPGDALRNEADYLRVWYNNLGRDSTVWIAEQQAAIKAFQRKGATWWALRVKGHLFQLTAGFGTSYPVAFATAEELIHDIDGLDCRQYPFSGNMYGDIGLLYYKFRDYEAAVPLLKKATRETPGFYFDDSNLKARNSLAIYYRQSGDRKRSDDYFISILQSPDTIYARAVYDAVALANLAHNLTRAGLYCEAIGLYELSLPIMISDNDYSFASGIAVGMAECYMGLDNWEWAKQWADTATAYIREHIHFINPHRARQIYPILAKYHQQKGDAATAGKYIDSLSMAHADYRDEFDAMLLMRTRQELLAEKNRSQHERLQQQQTAITRLVVFAVIAVLVSMLIYYLYHKKKAAYRELVEKNKRWADSDRLEQIIDPVSPNHTITEEKGEDGNRQQGPTEKDVELAARIHKIMVEGQIYRDNSLSLDTLSQKLEVTRETVSRAINRTTGKNFTRFLNEYRVKEAVRILSTGRNHTVNFDELAEQVGFNSRVTFHRAFKQLTGLPPAEFKKNS